MNRRKKRKAETRGELRMICLSMFLALAGMTGCGRKEPEFYTKEELTEASGTQDSEAGGEESQSTDAFAEKTQEGDAAETESQAEASESMQETAAGEETSAAGPAKIYVDVCGAVANPGVYELEADSRVFQAIELAGGYLPEAAQNYLNRAAVLADAQQIYVPTQAELDENPEKFGAGAAVLTPGVTAGAVSGQTNEAAADKVNLNTADLSELMTLTGIGEVRAQAIIAYRESSGAFQTIEDLMKVDGIKEGTYARIKDRITVG